MILVTKSFSRTYPERFIEQSRNVIEGSQGFYYPPYMKIN